VAGGVNLPGISHKIWNKKQDFGLESCFWFLG